MYAFQTGTDSVESAKKIHSVSQQCSDSNSVAFSQFSLSYQETELTTGTAYMGYHEIAGQMRFKDEH